VLILAAPAPVAATEALEPVKLRLKWSQQFQFAGYYAALEKGYGEDAGFDVEIQPRVIGITELASLEQDAVELAASDATAILHGLWGRPAVLVNPIFQTNPMVLITLEDSDIRSASDLAGKRLMYRRHLSGGNIAALLFRQGLTSSNYTGLTHSHDAMSVYITDQPFKQQSSGISSRIIEPHDDGVDFYSDLLVTSERYATLYPERAKAFGEAKLRGWAYAQNTPEDGRSHY
jgi:ABC-type nitrate/sulfonate/bicarbonate transport system substrate-binding protein